MAWRIDEQVIRGEIDNRVRGRVTGRIWLVGRDEPVELDFAGNAWRDLAGRRLEFANPDPKPGELKGFGARQTGVIGDCTASRKVKVPEVSMDELMRLFELRKPFPWHWGNSLYFEWFSTGNGRVVIESTSYQLTIDPASTWEMTPAEDTAQRHANAEAMGGFFQQLGDAAKVARDASSEIADVAPIEWNEEPAEEEIEDVEPKTGDEDKDDGASSLEASAAADRKHPLAARTFEAQLRLREEAEQRGWVSAGASDDHPVADIFLSVRDAARKFAGALNGRDWPPSPLLCEETIERLRLGRGYLSHALLAAEYCEQENLVEADWLANAQREINALRHACDLLVGELRTLLQPDEKDEDS